MKHVNKIAGFRIIIFIIFCLSAAASANANGFIFNWKPFVVDADLTPGNPSREVLIKQLSVSDVGKLIRDDSQDIFSQRTGQNNVSMPKAEKKSVLENIKIDIFQANKFMPQRSEMHPPGDDEQMSKFIDAMTSLIYDDSKVKSLETIGKIIEPQINFYFEF